MTLAPVVVIPETASNIASVIDGKVSIDNNKGIAANKHIATQNKTTNTRQK